MNSPVDRTRAPLAAALGTFDFPSFERTRLANGLEVLALRRAKVPLVTLELLVPGGGNLDPADQPGLASLHGALLGEGTKKRNAMELADSIERLGGSLSTGADWHLTFAAVDLLSENLSEGLEMVAEVLCSPRFEPREVERIRQRRLTEVQRRRVQPRSLAEVYFCRALYAGSVYDHPLFGTTEGLKKIGCDDVSAFYRRHIGAAGSTLLAIGDLDPATLLRWAEQAFGDWSGAPFAEPPAIEPPAARRTVHLVDLPGASQTQLQIGQVGVPRQHPGYIPRRVMNTILGGKFTSRINLNLREKHGFTYSAQSGFALRRGPGPFVMRTSVASESAGAAIGELLGEVERIRSEKVTQEELDETRDYLAGVLPYTLQNLGDLAKRLEDLVLYELPDTYYRDYPQALLGISREEVLAAARDFLDPATMTVVAVGPATELQPQLERFGAVEVWHP